LTGLSIHIRRTTDINLVAGRLAVHSLHGSIAVEAVAGAAADCVRRPTTTIYYECHTNTGQRSNFVIESKPLSTHHAADPSRTAPVQDGPYTRAVRAASRTDRAQAVHRRCPGTGRTERRQ